MTFALFVCGTAPSFVTQKRAQAAALVLPTMKTHGPEDRDYYQIMGVKPTAKLPEITAAYHLLARRHHPDVDSADPSLLGKFKLINEAYAVLSDPGRRREYDRQRRAKLHNPSIGSQHQGAPEEPLVAGGRQKPVTPRPWPVQGAEVELPITPEEARLGGPCDLVLRIPCVCDRCAGRQHVAGAVCPQCRGRGEVTRQHPLSINLPPGLQTGSLIRLSGCATPADARTGGLLLRIRVQPYW